MLATTETAAPTLSLRSGSREGATFTLEGRAHTTIGRGVGCDVVLLDGRVSRHHASIRCLEGHYVLIDEQSSNGTFLNGLSLRPGTGFSLRDGDVIEVGDQRLVFGTAARTDSSTPTDTTSHPIVDLTRDGYAQLDLSERRELQVAIQRAFSGGPRIPALEQSVEVVRDWLDAHTVALFMKDPRHELRAIAVLPVVDAARSLLPLARQSWAKRDGRLQENAAAVPLLRGSQVIGVIALDRAAKRPDRVDLALLAVLADRIAQALSVEGARAGDTRPGFAA